MYYSPPSVPGVSICCASPLASPSICVSYCSRSFFCKPRRPAAIRTRHVINGVFGVAGAILEQRWWRWRRRRQSDGTLVSHVLLAPRPATAVAAAAAACCSSRWSIAAQIYPPHAPPARPPFLRPPSSSVVRHHYVTLPWRDVIDAPCCAHWPCRRTRSRQRASVADNRNCQLQYLVTANCIRACGV
jgi:hypothetical protein